MGDLRAKAAEQSNRGASLAHRFISLPHIYCSAKKVHDSVLCVKRALSTYVFVLCLQRMLFPRCMSCKSGQSATVSEELCRRTALAAV